MTNAIDMNPAKAAVGQKPAGLGAGAGSAGAIGKDGLGKNGIGGQNGLDFISLIMARLQNNGALPIAEGAPTSSATSLKDQVSAIVAELGHTQAPAELAGYAELFQNGTAPLVPQMQNLPHPLTGDDSALDQSVMMNNGLLAQQLGLDPNQAGTTEIIDALKQAFGDLGIDLDVPVNTTTPSTAQPVSGEPSTPPQNIELKGPAQDISAHLNTLTSPQDPTQKPSPAQPDTQAAPEISPTNTQVLAEPLPPQNGQNTADVAQAVTGDDFIMGQALNLSNAGSAQSFMTAEAALKTAARNARGNSETALQNAPGQNIKANGAAPQNSAPNSPSLPPQAADKAAEMMAHHSATTQNSVGSNGGAASTPDFLTGDMFNTMNHSQSNTFDAQLSQQFNPDQPGANNRTISHNAFTATQYRAATPQVPVRAVTLTMQRGINNAVDRMSLQMEPADLGRVQVDLKMGNDGKLKAHILTDKPEALQILQKDSNILQKAFEEAGLDVGSEGFTFDLRDQNDQQLAQDKNNRESLFNIADVNGMAEDMDDINMMNAGIYSQQYINPNGVNLYV